MKSTISLLLLAMLPACNSVVHIKRTSPSGQVTEVDAINSAFVRRNNHTSRITKTDGTVIEDFGDEDSTRAGSLMLWKGIATKAAPIAGDAIKKAIP